jgi:large subunit ribosomal protein L19
MNGMLHQLKQELLTRYNAIRPTFRAGDTVVVYVPMLSKGKIVEKPFEGVCIRVTSSTFSVRKDLGADGIEMSYSFFTPTRVSVLANGKVRQGRIYYMRDMRGKKARIARDYGRKLIKDANS